MKTAYLFVCIASLATLSACDNSRNRDRADANNDRSVSDRTPDDKTTTFEQPGKIGDSKTDTGSAKIVTKKTTTETEKENIPTVEEKNVKADINRLSADEFQKLGLPKSVADNVTKYRSDHGDFKSVDELRNVPGMNQAWLSSMSSKLGVAQKQG